MEIENNQKRTIQLLKLRINSKQSHLSCLILLVVDVLELVVVVVSLVVVVVDVDVVVVVDVEVVEVVDVEVVEVVDVEVVEVVDVEVVEVVDVEVVEVVVVVLPILDVKINGTITAPHNKVTIVTPHRNWSGPIPLNE